MPGTVCYYDDLLVVGSTENELKMRTERLLRKLTSVGLKINPNKSQFNKSTVIFLGHLLSEKGIGIDPQKAEALANCPVPTSKEELQSFLGLINFYNSFVKDFSSLTAPLYDMLKKDQPFLWSSEIEKCWRLVIETLLNAPILKPFDPEQQVILTTDASQRGLGAVLSQCGRPIAFASKKLTPTQQKYSVLEKEAMAFFWSVTEKFSLYLKGRDFVWQTDHKPLETLLHPESALSKIASARIHRWARALMPYRYTIIGKRSKEIPVADGLSRLPYEPAEEMDTEADLEYVAVLECNPISQEQIRSHTGESAELKPVLEYLKERKEIRNGPYKQIRQNLSLHDGIIFYGNRPIIPETLREAALKSLHSGHPGIVQMKTLARSSMYWPGINNDCETIVKSCEICQAKKSTANVSSYKSWPQTSNYGDRIHIDFLGPIEGYMILVLVDSHTGWIDAYHSRNTTAAETIRMVRKSFSRFGVPKLIVSDNGPQFASEEFNAWLNSIGVRHLYSPPYHPASNGQAERGVRSFKEKERVLRQITDFGKRIDNVLVAFNSGSGADLKLLHRKLWKPVTCNSSDEVLKDAKHPVWFRVFNDKESFWEKGIAVNPGSPCTEGVDLEGKFWRRSTNHVKERTEMEDEVTQSKMEEETPEIKLEPEGIPEERNLRRSSRIRKPVERFTPT